MKDMNSRHVGRRGMINLLNGTFKQVSGIAQTKTGQWVGSTGLQDRGQEQLEQAHLQLRRAWVQRLVDEPIGL